MGLLSNQINDFNWPVYYQIPLFSAFHRGSERFLTENQSSVTECYPHLVIGAMKVIGVCLKWTIPNPMEYHGVSSSFCKVFQLFSPAEWASWGTVSSSIFGRRKPGIRRRPVLRAGGKLLLAVLGLCREPDATRWGHSGGCC